MPLTRVLQNGDVEPKTGPDQKQFQIYMHASVVATYDVAHNRIKKKTMAWCSVNYKRIDTKGLPAACRLFSRGVIFTRTRVSLALLSLRKNGGLLVV